jgi:archaemetzincin
MRYLVLCAVIACGSEPERAPEHPAPAAAPVAAHIVAIGDTSKLSPRLQRAFDPRDHEPAGKPGDGDWLAEHPEEPQPFDRYVKNKPNVPDDERRVIYLLPLGKFPASAPPIAALVEIVRAFYTLEVKTLPAVNMDDLLLDVTTRTNRGTGKLQLLSTDVLRWLTKRVPDDAFGVVAITMVDLYPDPSWNFVFGQASFRERVAVQSFARQDPAFFGEPRGAGWQLTALKRATWTLVHEIAHMFSISHCTHFRCVVAGSNHQEEADRAPLHPCPVCLRKLHHAIGFDPEIREVTLAAVLRKYGITDEAEWSERRARFIRDGHP